MVNGCVNCSLRTTWVALNTFFSGDPYTWTKVSGRRARVDCMCASTDLLAATRWAGVRKDIHVRIGSAEDHWPAVADVHLSIGEPRENKRTQTVSIDRTFVHDQKKCGTSQNQLEPVVLRGELEIGPPCSALTADVANAAIDCFKKANMSCGKTGYLGILGSSSSGLTVFVPTCVMRERMSTACDLMPTSGSVQQAPVGSRSAGKPELHSGGLKVLSPRNVTA